MSDPIPNGKGLSHVLCFHREKSGGVPNERHPQHDLLIPVHYTEAAVDEKTRNADVPPAPHGRPPITYVWRLDEHKRHPLEHRCPSAHTSPVRVSRHRSQKLAVSSLFLSGTVGISRRKTVDSALVGRLLTGQ